MAANLGRRDHAMNAQQFPWLGFVLIGAWCLLPIFGLGMLVGALIW
jgi:hypothetical protein